MAGALLYLAAIARGAAGMASLGTRTHVMKSAVDHFRPPTPRGLRRSSAKTPTLSPALHRLHRISRHVFGALAAYELAPRGTLFSQNNLSRRHVSSSARAEEKDSGWESGLREAARSIFRSACEAVDPINAVERALLGTDTTKLVVHGNTVADLGEFESIHVLAFGKASIGMAKGILHAIGSKIDESVVVTKEIPEQGHGLPSQFSVLLGKHPTPDKSSVDATQSVLAVAQMAKSRDLVIVCISGGGSSLLCAPRNGVSLEEMQQVTKDLLASGCTIQEKNAVLKHLSRVKGGQLRASIYPATCVSLVLSDVVGDPLDTIASGPTVGDRSSIRECMDIVEKYRMYSRLPKSIQACLAPDAKETPKPGDPMFAKDAVAVIANNRLAVSAAASKAKSLGYTPLVLGSHIEGDALEVATVMSGIAKSLRKDGIPIKPPVAVICGGETTMTLPPVPGLGGRNQALALRAMKEIDGLEHVCILSGGTDGGDGPGNDSAGAVVTGHDYQRALRAGLDYNAALSGADSYNFFKAYEHEVWGRANVMHLRDGPTGTNVMDIMLILVQQQQ